MKCIMHKDFLTVQKGEPKDIERVTDNAAQAAVASGHYVYVPRKLWKKAKAKHAKKVS